MTSTKKKNQQKPKWFKGAIYPEGEEVRNPFSNETYELNGLELSIYDFIMGCNLVFEQMPNTMTNKRINEFQKALTWFRVNNPEAYYVLLDQFSYPRYIARTHKVRAFRGMRTFDKYKKNLRQHRDEIWSYSTHVATIEGNTLKQLGWWSVTTQKHINYAAKELGLELIK